MFRCYLNGFSLVGGIPQTPNLLLPGRQRVLSATLLQRYNCKLQKGYVLQSEYIAFSFCVKQKTVNMTSLEIVRLNIFAQFLGTGVVTIAVFADTCPWDGVLPAASGLECSSRLNGYM